MSRADAPGGEVSAVFAVVALGEREKNIAGGSEGDIAEGGRNLAAHGEIFGAIRPALGWIYMSAFFHPEITVEVECTAYRPE